MRNRNISIRITTAINLSSIWTYMSSFMYWAFLNEHCLVSKIIYWDTVDKLKNIEEIMSIVFLGPGFLKMVGKPIMGEGRFVNGVRGWYLFLCKLWKNRCFLVALYSLIIRRTNLEVATKRFFHQQVKYWDSFSVTSHIKVCLYSYFWWYVYFSRP